MTLGQDIKFVAAPDRGRVAGLLPSGQTRDEG
jgi:hypothetical protein